MDEKKRTTMSVPEMRRMLGLGKTDSYWLVHRQCFETIIVAGKMRVVIDSFEHWYANQIKYKKVDGSPPGAELRAYSYSVQEMADLLGVSDDTVYTLIKRDHIETFEVDTWMRIRKDVFEAWYKTQTKYRTQADRERDAELEAASMTMPEMAKLLLITRKEVYNILLTGRDKDLCWFFWHELGHFYAINSEKTNLHHYSDPGLVDDSHIVEFTTHGPVLGLSDERLKQEGYWFWQEFIAEAISKYVSFKHRSNTKYYHPELMDWHPQYWGGIVDRLVGLLDDALWYYPSTIDEYALAHYFANLLMDDFIVLYVKAAADRKLKVYDNGNIIVPDDEIEPTCISDVDDERFRVQLWKMKELLETQVKKEKFWEIDEDFLLEIGTCIGELMFAKLKVMSEHF